MPRSTKPSNRRFRIVTAFPVIHSTISASVYTASESAVRSVKRSRTWPEVWTQLAVKTRDERDSIPMEPPRCWKVTETPAEWARPSFGTPRGYSGCLRLQQCMISPPSPRIPQRKLGIGSSLSSVATDWRSSSSERPTSFGEGQLSRRTRSTFS